MHNFKKSVMLILCICLLQTIIGVVHAECILPVADGDGTTPSLANIEGSIFKVSTTTLTINEKKTNLKHKVRLTQKTDYFTSFGGFYYPKELTRGQTAWIWFENCQIPKKGLPKAAIVQIYSTDPKHKP